MATDQIKQQIDERLAVLVGLPLFVATRAADMATFGFGRLIEREDRGLAHAAEFGLHIQETWRVTRAGKVLFGYGDWHYPPRNSTVAYEEFVERGEVRNRQDDLRDEWMAHGPEAHTVLEAVGSGAGDLAISFADGCTVETFVNQATSVTNGDDEFWRLIGPTSGSADGVHFVVTARGLS